MCHGNDDLGDCRVIPVGGDVAHERLVYFKKAYWEMLEVIQA